MSRGCVPTISSSKRIAVGCVATIAIAAACSGTKTPNEKGQGPAAPVQTPAAGRTNGGPPAQQTEDGQWLMPAKNYASTRFSGLNQITADNVKNLKLAWTFETGILRGQESAPLVVNNTMYIVTPFPNYLYALDLTKPGAPMKWVYKPRTLAAAQGVACCDVVNRGPSYADGKIVYNTLDNQTVAVDASSGAELWRTKVGEINVGESLTMAPLIVKNKVIIGNSGGEFGIRGWLTALDLATGKIAWRAYHTGPDSAVLIGPRFKPFYAADRKPNLGVETWPGDTWKHGGGAVWSGLAIDQDTDTLFVAPGNPGPDHDGDIVRKGAGLEPECAADILGDDVQSLLRPVHDAEDVVAQRAGALRAHPQCEAVGGAIVHGTRRSRDGRHQRRPRHGRPGGRYQGLR